MPKLRMASGSDAQRRLGGAYRLSSRWLGHTWEVMIRRRIGVVGLCFAIAGSVLSVPSEARAQFRAAKCCASSNCAARVSPSQCPCCQVRSGRDVGVLSAHPEYIGFGSSLLLTVTNSFPVWGHARPEAVPRAASGPPMYLRLRGLRC